MADYKYKPSIMIDDLLDGLKAVQKEAVSADKIIGMIGNKGNLNKLLAVFMSMDNMIEELIQDSDQLKSTFGTQLKGGFFTNLNDELGKLSDLIKQTQKMSEDVLNINLKKSGASTQLKEMATQINTVLESLGVSDKIDFDLFNAKSLKEQRDELIGYINSIGSEITLSVGKIDTSQLGNIGGKVEKDIDDVTKKVKKGSSKLKKEISGLIQSYYDAILSSNNANKAKAKMSIKQALAKDLGVDDISNEKLNNIFQGLDDGNIEESDAVDQIITLTENIKNTLNNGSKEVVSAFKDYFTAIQEATSSGLDVVNNQTSVKMTEIKNKINEMFADADYKVKFDLDSIFADLEYGDIGLDDIESSVNDLITSHDGITIKLPVKDAVVDTKDSVSDVGDEIEEEMKQASNSMEDTEHKVENLTDAFKELVGYINKIGKSPKNFFDSLESGAQDLDDELKAILTSLNLIDENGKTNFTSLKSGYTNKGGFVSDNQVMIARNIKKPGSNYSYLEKAKTLQENLAKAQQAGAQVGVIFDIIEDRSKGLFYEIQNTVHGTAAFSHHTQTVNQDALNATDAQIDDLIHTMQVLSQNGLYIDFGGDNILYDKDKGFSVIDLGLSGGYSHTVSVQNTLQENVERMLSEMMTKASPDMKDVIQNAFSAKMYNAANKVLPADKQIQYAVTKPSQQQAKAIQQEETAHENNTDAIKKENKAIEAQIELKRKAQSMSWEEFALDESLSGLKNTAGIKSLGDLEQFWKGSNYAKQVDFKEIDPYVAKGIIENKIDDNLLSGWFGGSNHNAKNKIENQILADNELRNAAMNWFYHLAQKYMSDVYGNFSFTDFLNSEIDVFRSDDGPVLYDHGKKLSFSLSAEKAKEITGGEKVEATKIKPIDTVGNVSTGVFEDELEFFLPNYALPKGQNSLYVNGKQTSFDEYYAGLDPKNKDRLKGQIIYQEKKRIEDLLGEDITKLVRDASPKMAFHNDALDKFKQGIVPDNLSMYGDSVIDELTDVYNNASDIQKKLIAYYASLNAMAIKPPGWKSEHQSLGQTGTIDALMKDPSGYKKFVNDVTGISKFNLFGGNAEDINEEAKAHLYSVMAIKKETDAQADLNQVKKQSVDAVSESINSSTKNINPQDVKKQLYDMWWNTAANTEKENDTYQLYSMVDDEISDISQINLTEAYQLIDKIESEYAEDLSDLKQYLLDKYGAAQKVEPQISQEDVVNKLYNMQNNASTSSPEWSDKWDLYFGVKYKDDESENIDLQHLYDLVDKIEAEYNEDLADVKQYLLDKYGAIQSKPDPVPAKLTPEDAQQKLWNLYAYAPVNSDKESDTHALYGMIRDNNEYGDPIDLQQAYDLIDKIESQYAENLADIREYLLDKFGAAQSVPEIDVVDGGSGDEFTTVYNKLNDAINQTPIFSQSDKLQKLYSVLDALNYANSTDQNIIDDGFYFDPKNLKETKISTIFDLINEIESTYGENLDYVSDYLKQIYKNANLEAQNVQEDFDDEIFVELDDDDDDTVSNKKQDLSLGDSSQSVQNEIVTLESLQNKINDVITAVDFKTQAFENEDNTVKAVVENEINALKQLEAYLDSLKLIINNLFDGFDVPNIPTIDANNTQFDAKNVKNISGGDWALDTTLKETNSILEIIFDALTSDDNSKLVTAVETAMNELKNVASGIVQQQKAQKIDTKAASARIADSTTYKQISDIARNAASGLGEIQLDSLTALKDGIVKVEGAFKNADGVWEGFSVKVNTANEAVDLAIKKQSAFAKSLNETSKQTQEATQAPKTKTVAGTSIKTQQDKFAVVSNKAAGYSQTSTVTKELNAYKNAMEELKKAQYELIHAENLSEDELEQKRNAFAIARDACNSYAQKIEQLIKASINFDKDHTSVTEDIGNFDLDSISGQEAALRRYVDTAYGGKATIVSFDNANKELIFTFKDGEGKVQQMAASFDASMTKIGSSVKEANKSTSLLGSLFGDLGKKWKELWVYASARFGVDEIIQQVRNGIQYVREIDSALTELKKVTDETDASYKRFLQDMSKTAGVVGSTVAELTTMSAEWARLGYSMEEAGQLAESTAILLNVSEFSDATEASEALISTMQAFSYTADESQHVVDILNEVGNNFAVSSDGIATALQDSASALMEGGNNLEQAVALVAAANKVVQDPNSVGSALRTISLRLRGTSVKVLEEMGEETDGVVSSISKMQGQIKALTGVDIIDMNGAYKDTYTILQEIGTVWEDMSDIDQAALLELMAGKNRANTLAAILGNMEDLEGAYESALNSEGSALKENEAYLDSIQGKIDILTNSVQTMWYNALNSEAIKFLLDIANALVKIVDNAGLLKSVFAVLVGYLSFNGETGNSLGLLNKIFPTLGNNILSVTEKFGLGKKAAALFGSALSGLAGFGIGFAIQAFLELGDAVINAKKKLSDAVDEITNKYTDAKNTIDSNLKSLTTPVDTNIYKSLEDEFAHLAAGVDKNGNNMSLTADEYERYRDICETICGINPNLALGYDSVTEAIGNNASVLSHLIELQKDEARQEAFNYVKDENFKKIAKDAVNDYKDVYSDLYDSKSDLMTKISDEFTVENSSDPFRDNVINLINSLNLFDREKQNLIADVQKNYNNASGAFDWQGWIDDNIELLEANIKHLPSEFADLIGKYNTSSKELDNAKNNMMYALMQVPASMEEYDEFSDSEKSFITQWIKNSGAFDIDENTTAGQILEWKAKIKQMVWALNDEDYTYEVSPGNVITAQDILDSIYDLDPSSANWEQYKTQMDTLVSYLWESVGGENNKLGANGTALDKNSFLEMFGLYNPDEGKIKKQIISTISRIKGWTEEEATNFFNNSSAVDVQRWLKLDWNVITNEEELEKVLNPKISSTTSVQMISALTDKFNSYKEILSQTSEIVVDNTEVTQEYKDSLIELGIGEEELNEYFDENNDLIVTNAKGLNDLVKSSSKNIQNNAKLAKSHARLKYYDLYKQMYKLSKGSGQLTGATLNQVNALYDQMNAVEKTIAKYSILEQELLGAADAFTAFEDAQTADSETDYISSVEDMALALGEAFNKAELGSETAQVAIAGLVPESVYKDLDTVDEKMSAIYEYFKTGKLSQYLDIQYDEDGAIESAEMKLANLRNFIEDGLDKGIFVGEDWQHFDLSDEIKTLDDFAAAMGVTKELTFAFFESIEDHDIEWLNGDYSTLFDKLIPDISTIKTLKEQMQKEFDQANVDLSVRPQVSWEKMHEANWFTEEGSYSTVDTQTYFASDFGLAEKGSENDYAVNVTPILPDGTVIDNGKNGEGLWEYIMGKVDSGESIEDLDIFLGSYKTLEEAKVAADRLHDLQEEYFSSLENFNLENSIYENISDLADLEYQLANGKISAEEYANTFNELSKTNVELADMAREESAAWYEKTEQLNEYKNQLTDYYAQLESGKDANGNVIDVEEMQKNIDETVGHINTLTKELSILNEPTEVVLQFAIDDVDKDLETITKRIGEVVEGTHYKLNVETGEYQVILDKTDPNYQEVMDYVNLLNERHSLEMQMGEGTPTVVDQLSNIADILDKITKMLATRYNIDVETGEALKQTNAFKDIWESIKDKGVTLWATIKEAFSGPKKTTTESNPNSSSNNKYHNLPRVNGSAHASGDWGIPKAEHNSLVGELGQELVVDPHSGRYYTVGDNGAEFVDLPKDAIIFNHKQTESLLSHGYVTGRGKAYAEGNAHVTIFGDGASESEMTLGNNSNSNSDDIKDEVEEVVDFIEIKLEEIEQTIAKTTAELENYVDDTSTVSEKNNLYDNLVSAEKDRANTYLMAAEEYNRKATEALKEIPAEYRKMAMNGAIAIKDFVGEDQAEIAEAINNYREWSNKADDAEVSYLESIAQQAALRVEQLQDIASDYENIIGVIETSSGLIEAHMDFVEESGERLSATYYKELIKNSKDQKKELEEERKDLQRILDRAVRSGDVQKGSDEWYEMLDTIYEVDEAIVQCDTDIEEFNNSINELKFENLEKLIDRFDDIDSQLSHLHDRFTDGKIVDDEGEWNSDGIAAIGVLTQQMEVAEMKSRQYAEAIDELKEDYKNGLYSEDEFNEKLAELTENQWDAIESYESAKDAIVDLNKTRIDAVKDGIQEEIDAYKELIDKKKEALDADKDLYDFEKNVQEQQKDIATIERKLAALSGDTSASAAAQRKVLEAELAEAKANLEDTYRDRSIENQKNALDDAYEKFEEAKNKEMEALDEYLEREDEVIGDSVDIVKEKENAKTVLEELKAVSEQYGIDISNAIVSPWEDGANAVMSYDNQFGEVSESFIAKLQAIIDKEKELQKEADNTATGIINGIEESEKYTTSAKRKSSSGGSSRDDGIRGWTDEELAASEVGAPQGGSSGGSNSISKGQTVVVDKNAKNFSSKSGNASMASFVKGGTYEVMQTSGNQVLIGKGGTATGWVDKKDLDGYAKGTTKIKDDQFAWIDEIGEELVLHAGSDGKLAYLTKDSGVIPADLTSKLMKLALDPTQTLENSRPIINAPHITNNEINIDMTFGEVVHIDTVTNDTIPDLTNAVEKQMDKYMKNLNNQIRRYAK